MFMSHSKVVYFKCFFWELFSLILKLLEVNGSGRFIDSILCFSIFAMAFDYFYESEIWIFEDCLVGGLSYL